MLPNSSTARNFPKAVQDIEVIVEIPLHKKLRQFHRGFLKRNCTRNSINLTKLSLQIKLWDKNFDVAFPSPVLNRIFELDIKSIFWCFNRYHLNICWRRICFVCIWIDKIPLYIHRWRWSIQLTTSCTPTVNQSSFTIRLL